METVRNGIAEFQPCTRKLRLVERDVYVCRIKYASQGKAGYIWRTTAEKEWGTTSGYDNSG